MTVLLPLSFSSWLLAGLSHSGLSKNVYISEDLCRTSEAGSPNPWGSVEHRLRTTDLGTRDNDNNRQGCIETAAAEDQCWWLGGIIHWYVRGCDFSNKQPAVTN